LRMQASRQKPNYKKGLNRKFSSGCHIDNKGTKKNQLPCKSIPGVSIYLC
jgi:hypothetical protein